MKIDQFLPYFFARFYRCRGVKIGFGDDLGIFLRMEGGKGEYSNASEPPFYHLRAI